MKQRTGTLIQTFIDMNPLSPTYGQSKVETIEESDICTNWQPDMVLISSTDTTNTYTDVNETSYTYGVEIQIDIDSTEPYLYTVVSECEQIQYPGIIGNSGNIINTKVDLNPNSDTYQQLSEETIESVECEKPDTSVKTDRVISCVVTTLPSGISANTGQVHIQIYDVNPYSQYYNTIIQDFYVQDTKTCKVADTTPNFITICSYCETNQYGGFTGNRIDIIKDINMFSDSYNSETEKSIYDESCFE